jgi:hypothetical protein
MSRSIRVALRSRSTATLVMSRLLFALLDGLESSCAGRFDAPATV